MMLIGWGCDNLATLQWAGNIAMGWQYCNRCDWPQAVLKTKLLRLAWRRLQEFIRAGQGEYEIGPIAEPFRFFGVGVIITLKHMNRTQHEFAATIYRYGDQSLIIGTTGCLGDFAIVLKYQNLFVADLLVAQI